MRLFISLLIFSFCAYSGTPVDKDIILKKILNRELSFRSDHLFWLTSSLNHDELVKFSKTQKLANPNFDPKYFKKRFVIDGENYHHDFVFDYITNRCVYATYSKLYDSQVRECRKRLLECTYKKEKSGSSKDVLESRSNNCQESSRICKIDHSVYKEESIDLKYCKVIYGD